MNIGIFGGSFDPIHTGHLLFAQQMLDLVPLDKVIFVPAYNQYMKEPHKASFIDRCSMVSKAIDGNPRFDFEVIKDEENTYAYNILKILKEKHPDDSLFFLAGEDIVDDLTKWHRIEDLGKLCTMAIGSRNSDNNLTRASIRHSNLKHMSGKYNLAFVLISTEIEFGVSSTYIRRKIKDRESIAYLIPEKVIDHIYTYDLYKE